MINLIRRITNINTLCIYFFPFNRAYNLYEVKLGNVIGGLGNSYMVKSFCSIISFALYFETMSDIDVLHVKPSGASARA